MADQTIIVTGASRGLGEAAARIAAQIGARVVLNARSADALERIAEEIREAGGEALAVPGDVSQPEVPPLLVETALARFGAVDALVNNAGVIEPIASAAEVPPEAFRDTLDINLIGPITLAQAALPHLRQRRGRIINVSSGAGVNPVRGWLAYCASKAALNMFNAVLAAEEQDVTAIALRPGLVDSSMQVVIRQTGADGMPPDEHGRFLRYHQQGDLHPPQDAGRALAVLALYAPPAWSGSFISWEDLSVQDLVRQHAPYP